LTGKGKWSSLALKKPKQAGGKKNNKKLNQKAQSDPWAREGMDDDDSIDVDVRAFPAACKLTNDHLVRCRLLPLYSNAKRNRTKLQSLKSKWTMLKLMILY
jgi:hypothetical protein